MGLYLDYNGYWVLVWILFVNYFGYGIWNLYILKFVMVYILCEDRYIFFVYIGMNLGIIYCSVVVYIYDLIWVGFIILLFFIFYCCICVCCIWVSCCLWWKFLVDVLLVEFSFCELWIFFGVGVVEFWGIWGLWWGCNGGLVFFWVFFYFGVVWLGRRWLFMGFCDCFGGECVLYFVIVFCRVFFDLVLVNF